MKVVLAGIGGAATVVAVVLGVGGAAASAADPTPTPNPSLPTFFTNPQTYIVQGDGTRIDCVAIDQALSCPGSQQ